MMATKIWAGGSLTAMVVSAASSTGLVGACAAGCLSIILFLIAAHEPTRRRSLRLLGSGKRHVDHRHSARR